MKTSTESALGWAPEHLAYPSGSRVARVVEAPEAGAAWWEEVDYERAFAHTEVTQAHATLSVS